MNMTKKKKQKCMKLRASHILVGVSPLHHTTERSGRYGPEYDGNSFLIDMGGLEYVFIGTNFLLSPTERLWLLVFHE
jgi:hypothetical protein